MKILVVVTMSIVLGCAFAAAAQRDPISDTRVSQATGLKIGEYACYGSGGTLLIGLGFKVLAGGKYTDLDNKNAGTYVVSGANVTFRGGHLDGQKGKDLKDYKFTLGTMAGCEPF